MLLGCAQKSFLSYSACKSVLYSQPEQKGKGSDLSGLLPLASDTLIVGC